MAERRAGAANPPQRRQLRRPSVRRLALAAGIGVAFWVHAEAFSRPLGDFYHAVRWPYIVAGAVAMILATARPMRWMMLAFVVAAPTSLTGCYFVGTSIAARSGMPWQHVRIAATMFVATAIGAIIGRVAGGIRSGQ